MYNIMESSMEMYAFIKCYENLPELWDYKNENYKNKSIRDSCYNTLLKVYRNVKSDATIQDLKKKIANMRTSYRRELKKVINSERSGAEADHIYTSTLWYYDAFKFVGDFEMSLTGRSSSSPDKDEEKAFINMEKTQTFTKRTAANVRTNFLEKAVAHLESSSKNARVEDEATAYANGWAHMYRQMDPTQQLFAKRAVDEIMMMGRLNQLTYDTVPNIFDGSLFLAPSIPRAATPRFNSDSADFF